MDGLTVHCPIGNVEKGCKSNSAPSIDENIGHQHFTADFTSGNYLYHLKTAIKGGKNNPVFWITNECFMENRV